MRGTCREVFPKDGADGEWIDTPDRMTTEQSIETLGRDVSKWSEADRAWAREQLRSAFTVTVEKLLKMKCSPTVH